jgi:hypothetical protein
MFKKVSCWPAKEASGKSSAVAEERTATAMSGLPFESAVNASRTSCSNSFVMEYQQSIDEFLRL